MLRTAINNNSILLLFVACIPAFMLGCGVAGVNNGVPVFNDPVPEGDILAQGNFIGQNGRTVTGVASIYKLDSNGVHIVRLEGITVQSGTALEVIAVANGEQVLQASLKGLTGNQAYETNVTTNRTWNKVTIRTRATTLNPEFGTAILNAP
jgi:hypothetical protein